MPGWRPWCTAPWPTSPVCSRPPRGWPRPRRWAEASGAAGQPQLALSGDATLQRFSARGLVPPAVAGTVRSSATLQAGGRWSLDLGGRQAAEWQAALGQQRAAAADVQAARTLLATQLVQGYVELARLGRLQGLVQRQLSLQQQGLALVRQRAQAGLDTQAEARGAELPPAELQQQLARLDEQAQLLRHQLALLSGQAPAALQGLQPVLVTAPPWGGAAAAPRLGADLLGRRADLVAARWRVEAAQQGVAEARARFYPDVDLVGFAGLNVLGLNHLLDLGARTASVGPALRLPLFDGGRLQADLDGRAAVLDGAIAHYNLTLLQAVREAADALASLQALEHQQHTQDQALASARAAQALVQARFDAGLGDRRPLLAAAQASVAQERTALDLQARRLSTLASLAQALGGGWQDNADTPPVAAPAAAPGPVPVAGAGVAAVGRAAHPPGAAPHAAAPARPLPPAPPPDR